MSKKSALSFAVSLSKQSDVSAFDSDNNYATEESLNTFHNYMFQLKEEVNRLSFMMSEIRSVVESSSSTRRFLA